MCLRTNVSTILASDFRVAEKKYDASLISRWLERLGEYVKQGDGDDTFANAEDYLQLLVDEKPVPEEKLSFEQGAGICSVIDKVELIEFRDALSLSDISEMFSRRMSREKVRLT